MVRVRGVRGGENEGGEGIISTNFNRRLSLI